MGAVSAQPRRCRGGFAVVLRVCFVLRMRLLNRRLLFPFVNRPDSWAASERELVAEEMASDW